MPTARTLINQSLRIVGALASGESPQAAEANDALATLNTLIDTWATNTLMVYETKRQVVTLTGGQQTYTFGPTGNFVDSTVTDLRAASSLYGGNMEVPMRFLSVTEWQDTAVKAVSSGNPSQVYVEYTHPNLTLNFWPVPSTNSQVALYFRKPIAEIATLDTEIDLPAGYREAIVYSLAARLFPEYGRPIDPVVAQLASQAIASIKRSNNKPDYMANDAQLLAVSRQGSYSVFSNS